MKNDIYSKFQFSELDNNLRVIIDFNVTKIIIIANYVYVQHYRLIDTHLMGLRQFFDFFSHLAEV